MPEAFVGGPIALVEDGDKIVIDTEKRSIDWLVDEEEQARRRAKWQQREYPEKRGVLFRYARDVAVSVSLYCDSVAVGCVLIWGTWWAACECWRVLRLKRLSMGVRIREMSAMAPGANRVEVLYYVYHGNSYPNFVFVPVCPWEMEKTSNV